MIALVKYGFAKLCAALSKRLNGNFAPRRRRIAWRRAVICAEIAVSCPALAAIPPDPVSVVRLLAQQDEAVLRVGERLVVAGAPLCGESGRSAGMTVQQLSQYGEAYRVAARATLGIDQRPTVAYIASGGAAEAAGIRAGDVITAIDNRQLADAVPVRRKGDFAGVAATHDLIDAALTKGPITLTVARAGKQRDLVLTPRRACGARFDVRAGHSSNATSDGTYIQIASDLVADTTSDGELAAVLAHELAHNILRHPQRLKAKGSRPSVRSTEIEADRLSVYLLDAAGFAPEDAIGFWGRWGRAHDHGIFTDGTHPGWRMRVATLQTETAAIVALRNAGRPVRPPADLSPR